MQCSGQRVDGTNTFSFDQLSVFDLTFLCSMIRLFGFVLNNDLVIISWTKTCTKVIFNSLVQLFSSAWTVLLTRKLWSYLENPFNCKLPPLYIWLHTRKNDIHKPITAGILKSICDYCDLITSNLWVSALNYLIALYNSR